MQELVQKVKVSLGISHVKLDDDISDSVDSCIKDMRRVGILKTESSDPLVVQAVKLFCKWQYNFQGDADRFERAYAGLRDSMSLSGEYNGVAS